MLPVLYIWAGVSGVLLPAQVWTLANYTMTTREAKRLFGIVGSGALCGWMVGGLITTTVATRLHTESLLLLTAVTLAICPILVVMIWRERRVETVEVNVVRTDEGSLAESVSLVWNSPYLRSIAGLVLLCSLVTTLATWQFKTIAKTYYPETDELTAFFGSFQHLRRRAVSRRSAAADIAAAAPIRPGARVAHCSSGLDGRIAGRAAVGGRVVSSPAEGWRSGLTLLNRQVDG